MLKIFNTKETEQGFTIVELMIATIVFSMVLLVCSFAIMHVGRMYYKGVIMSRTQDVSRKVVDDVVEAIQYGGINDKLPGGPINLGDGPGFEARSYCIGNARYSFTNERSLGDKDYQSKHVLWRDYVVPNTACNVVDISNEPADETGSNLINDKELLSSNMRLPKFNITRDNITGIWTVEVTVSYGELEDFEPADPDNGIEEYSVCKGTNAGGQFCAVSTYSTTVKSRL